MHRNAALREFLNDLEHARRTFIGDGENPQREGVDESVGAVIAYLQNLRVDAQSIAPLHALRAAFTDARDGLENPIFAPEKHKHAGGTKKRQYPAVQMGVAAAAVTILKDDAGWPLPKALAAAARAIGRDAKSIDNFRKNIGARRAPTKAIENYDYFLQTFRHYSGLSPEERGRKLLDMARKLTGR